LVVLQAENPIEAVRLQAERLFVFRRGKILASAPPRGSMVSFGGTETRIDFTRANIAGV
jgi:cytosine deaminase